MVGAIQTRLAHLWIEPSGLAFSVSYSIFSWRTLIPRVLSNIWRCTLAEERGPTGFRNLSQMFFRIYKVHVCWNLISKPSSCAVFFPFIYQAHYMLKSHSPTNKVVVSLLFSCELLEFKLSTYFLQRETSFEKKKNYSDSHKIMIPVLNTQVSWDTW